MPMFLVRHGHDPYPRRRREHRSHTGSGDRVRRRPGIHVLGPVSDETAALALFGEAQPDIVVVELDRLDGRGVAIISEIRSRTPVRVMAATRRSPQRRTWSSLWRREQAASFPPIGIRRAWSARSGGPSPASSFFRLTTGRCSWATSKRPVSRRNRQDLLDDAHREGTRGHGSDGPKGLRQPGSPSSSGSAPRR